MGLSISHLLILMIVVLIVFGAGRLPKVMGDLGKGIHNFKDGLKGDGAKIEQITDHQDNNKQA
jgi:sec-independent protein translocase protein TatA